MSEKVRKKIVYSSAVSGIVNDLEFIKKEYQGKRNELLKCRKYMQAISQNVKTLDELIIDIKKNHFLFALISDTHIDRKNSSNAIKYAYERIYERGTDYVIHLGDLTDGIDERKKTFINQEKRFEIAQKLFVNDYPKVPNLDTIILGGNHDYNFYKYGLDFLNDIVFQRDDFIFAGFNLADIKFEKFTLQAIHDSNGIIPAGNNGKMLYFQNYDKRIRPDIIGEGHIHSLNSHNQYGNNHHIHVTAFMENNPNLSICWVEVYFINKKKYINISFEIIDKKNVYQNPQKENSLILINE